MKALLVDDDQYNVELMTYALQREGYTVIAAIDGQQALTRWEAEKPDIVLLDVNMPKLNGFEVCRRIRHEAETPIIMLTARDEEEDVVRGLHLGADDYVTKPFSPKLLASRMEAVLRRCQTDRYLKPTREVRVGDLCLDRDSYQATKAGKVVQLTPLEFRILYLLAMNAGRVIPYSRLVEYAWGYDGGDASLLKTHISHMRTKLGLSAEENGNITAVPGVGYRLTQS